MIDESPLRIRYEAVRSSLDERSRRLSAAAEAKAAGYGGIAAASRVTKLARSTIGRGLKDLRDPGSLGRKVRCKGGAALGWRRRIRRCWWPWNDCSSRRRWAIRCDRCDGSPKATTSWRRWAI